VRAGVAVGRGAGVHRISSTSYGTAVAVMVLLACSVSIALAAGAIVERLTHDGVVSAEAMQVSSVRIAAAPDRWHDRNTWLLGPHVVDRSFDEPGATTSPP
jgi:hypothetical protein